MTRLKVIAGVLLWWTLCACCMTALADGVDGTLYVVQVSKDVLNIRERPTINSPEIGYLLKNDTVVAIGYDGGWTQVEAPVEAGGGWVKSEYLTTSTDDYGQYINNSGGNVRIRNGICGEKIGKLKAGKKVTVSAWGKDADGETWAFIGSGYIMAKYVSKVE